jgi:hypothetical protein
MTPRKRSTPLGIIAPLGMILLLLALFTAFALVLQPSRRSVEAATTSPAPTIALIGDSITDQTRLWFTAELEPSYKVSLVAEPGRTIDQLLPAAQEAAAQKPTQVIVNLGSNDVLTGIPLEESVAALKKMVDAFPKETCVHLVTVNESFFLMFRVDLRDHATALNNEMIRLANDRGFHIIDWAQRVRDYYASGAPEGQLTADTVHPTDLGKRMLADEYRAAADLC